MSARPLRGAQPAVQPHHEHVVTHVSAGGWPQVKHFYPRGQIHGVVVKANDSQESDQIPELDPAALLDGCRRDGPAVLRIQMYSQ